MRSKICLFFSRAIGGLLLFVCCSAGLTAQPGRQEEDPPPARLNPILREYFRPIQAPEWHPMQSRFLQAEMQEDLIDRQIDRFVQELEIRLKQIETDFEAAKAAIPPHSAEPGQAASLERCAEAVHSLSRHLRALQRLLTRIPLGLNRKASRLKPEESGDPSDAVAAAECHFREAEARIIRYFLRPSHVVRLQELQNGNMLTHLDEAVRVTRDLHRRLNG